MKLDYDCIRDLLLTLEKRLQPGEAIFIDKICSFEEMTGHSKDAIQYTIANLNDAGVIEAMIAEADDDPFYSCGVSDITYEGHKFLNTIRDPKMLSALKKALNKAGKYSLDFAIQVGTALASELVKSL